MKHHNIKHYKTFRARRSIYKPYPPLVGDEVSTDLTAVDLSPLGAQVGAEEAEVKEAGAVTAFETALKKGLDVAEVAAEPLNRWTIARAAVTLGAKLARWVRDR